MRTILSIAIILAVSTMIARGQSLEQQTMRAKQAKIAFEENNGDNERLEFQLQLKIAPIGSDYRSHYNPKLNKCFVLIERTVETGGGEISITSQLMDGFERRIFATYSWTSTKEGYEDGETLPPTTCELKPTPPGLTICFSRKQFDAFVSKYMEEDGSGSK
jgi:hypothetical protein